MKSLQRPTQRLTVSCTAALMGIGLLLSSAVLQHAAAKGGSQPATPAQAAPLIDTDNDTDLADAFWSCELMTRHGWISVYSRDYCNEVTSRVLSERFNGDTAALRAWRLDQWGQDDAVSYAKAKVDLGAANQ